jgi:hypothetical protein
MSQIIPKKIFIIPYRNRPQHKFFFSKYMSFLLEDFNNYEIYFSHQCDNRAFNRGAIKNIGFLAMKAKYPNHYKNITYIFNDVDTLPFNKIFNYDTQIGVVKHYYGYKHALGGIVVMKGEDFEKINGFPCFWGWGMEDNILQTRCLNNNIMIDRTDFYSIGSPQILQLFDGITRIISNKDPLNDSDNINNGLTTINNLKYTIDIKSTNVNDNLFTIIEKNTKIINISSFSVLLNYNSDTFHTYDLRESSGKIKTPKLLKPANVNTVLNTTSWKEISYKPTTLEKKINNAKLFISRKQKVPVALINEINKLKKMNFNNY